MLIIVLSSKMKISILYIERRDRDLSKEIEKIYVIDTDRKYEERDIYLVSTGYLQIPASRKHTEK